MSIFDHPDGVPPAPSWRCPHCGTLQPETVRCWACLRSPVSCGSCQFFRKSVASELTYCGLELTRAPVHRDEVRVCWRPNTNRVDVEAGLFTQAQLEQAPPDQTSAAPTAVASSGIPPAAFDSVPVRASSGPLDRPDRVDDGLVEAPHVAPGRGFVHTARRPARVVRQSSSGDLDLD